MNNFKTSKEDINKLIPKFKNEISKFTSLTEYIKNIITLFESILPPIDVGNPFKSNNFSFSNQSKHAPPNNPFIQNDDQNKSDSIPKMEEQKEICDICLEEFNLLDPLNYYLNCNCIIHAECFIEHVKSSVENNTIPIKCPKCSNEIHDNIIRDALTQIGQQNLIEKYDKFSMNKYIQEHMDEYSSCPTPGCDYMFFYQQGDTHFRCELCKKEYCLQCHDDWHRGVTCEQYKSLRDESKLDKQFLDFVKGAKFKMCPKCKFWVEKNQGCDHMRCRCGIDFCYVCGEVMDMSRGHVCNPHRRR